MRHHGVSLLPYSVFAPVWTALYVMGGVASYRIYRKEAGKFTLPLKLYVLQLALNLGWSKVFFGYKQLGLAAVWSGALMVAIGFTIKEFKEIDETAALLMVPYFAWVTYATALAVGIWAMN